MVAALLDGEQVLGMGYGFWGLEFRAQDLCAAVFRGTDPHESTDYHFGVGGCEFIGFLQNSGFEFVP